LIDEQSGSFVGQNKINVSALSLGNYIVLLKDMQGTINGVGRFTKAK